MKLSENIDLVNCYIATHKQHVFLSVSFHLEYFNSLCGQLLLFKLGQYQESYHLRLSKFSACCLLNDSRLQAGKQ